MSLIGTPVYDCPPTALGVSVLRVSPGSDPASTGAPTRTFSNPPPNTPRICLAIARGSLMATKPTRTALDGGSSLAKTLPNVDDQGLAELVRTCCPWTGRGPAT